MEKQLLQSIAILTLILAVFGQNDQIDFSIYHSSEALQEGLTELSNNCNQRLKISKIGNNPEMQVISVNSGREAPNKAFLLFGEHPRELISSETGFQLLHNLCQDESSLSKKINQEYELQVILNANPISRQKVQQGNFCLRENEKGVDINRNYDAHWEHVVDDMQQVSSGESPFSESETQAISAQVKEFQPHMFVSIHSGTLGLYTPYAYSEDLALENQDNMIDILETVNDDHCKLCSVGAAGKEVGYLCPGTCLDWAYDAAGIKYSFAIEIYENGVDLRQEFDSPDAEDEVCIQLQQNGSKNFLGQEKKQKTNPQKAKADRSCFLQSQQKTQSRAKDRDSITQYEKCFLYFNPEQKNHFDFTVENWSMAIMKMMDKTSEKRKVSTQ